MSQHNITHIRRPGIEKISPEWIYPFAANRDRKKERKRKRETEREKTRGKEKRENVMVQKIKATVVSYFTSFFLLNCT